MMNIKLIDVMLFGNCILVGVLIIGIVRGSIDNGNMVEEHDSRIERVEQMTADIDKKMDLILNNVKDLKKD